MHMRLHIRRRAVRVPLDPTAAPPQDLLRGLGGLEGLGGHGPVEEVLVVLLEAQERACATTPCEG